jgi:hypothetical protein
VILPETTEARTGITVVYDLADPASWEQAREDRAAWGKDLTEIHRLDNNHVAIEFKPGGALEEAA